MDPDGFFLPPPKPMVTRIILHLKVLVNLIVPCIPSRIYAYQTESIKIVVFVLFCGQMF